MMKKTAQALLLGFLLLSGLPGAAWAGETGMDMVSARPLALIYAALRPNHPVAILLPHDRDMHDYALTVADIGRLHDTRMFFWLGGTSEPFLAPVSRRFPDQQWVAVAGNEGHAWLDAVQLPAMVDRMAAALAQAYPAEKADIARRQLLFKQQIAERVSDWRQRLAPVAGKPFLMGHDAFFAFARQVGLQHPLLYRASHDHGHVQGGMKELLAIQQRIASGEITCALEEPEVSFEALSRRYPTLRIGRLEPMAGSVPVGEAAYLQWLDASASSLARCLGLSG